MSAFRLLTFRTCQGQVRIIFLSGNFFDEVNKLSKRGIVDVVGFHMAKSMSLPSALDIWWQLSNDRF
jgi:hypothetical protein